MVSWIQGMSYDNCFHKIFKERSSRWWNFNKKPMRSLLSCLISHKHLLLIYRSWSGWEQWLNTASLSCTESSLPLDLSPMLLSSRRLQPARWRDKLKWNQNLRVNKIWTSQRAFSGHVDSEKHLHRQSGSVRHPPLCVHNSSRALRHPHLQLWPQYGRHVLWNMEGIEQFLGRWQHQVTLYFQPGPSYG